MKPKNLNIAIILDGNRRWSKENKRSIMEGHKSGFTSIKNIIKYSSEKLNISSFSVYAFSTENWNRSKLEVDLLMKLFRKVLTNEFQEIIDNDIRLIHAGRKDRLDKNILKIISDLEEKSVNNKKMVVYLCMDYGGKDEIVRAVKKISDAGNKSSEIDECLISQYLDIPAEHTPHILIRTSNEHRLSNFLLWHLAYTELFFIDKYLPDFSISNFLEILEDFQKRNRRFGR